MDDSKYAIKNGDQIRLTRTDGGWVGVIAPKDAGFIGRAPTAGSTFSTPEEALADLKMRHLVG